jgi:hypothetical protein
VSGKSPATGKARGRHGNFTEAPRLTRRGSWTDEMRGLAGRKICWVKKVQPKDKARRIPAPDHGEQRWMHLHNSSRSWMQTK